MSFNVSSITPAHLAELYQDGQVKTLLESYLATRLIKARFVKQVGRKAGSIDLAHASLLTPDARGIAAAKVGDYGDTPLAHTKMGVLDYVCQDLRMGSPLPQNVYASADQALSDLSDLLIYNAGTYVKGAAEMQLINILNGTTGSTPTDLTGKEWDAYTDADHNPVQDLLNARRAGANVLVLGQDVAIALMQSPKFTGSSAGGGVEFLTEEQLVAKIQGLGYAEVWIGANCWSRGAGLNQAPAPAQLHDGLACAFIDGALMRVVYSEFEFDQYEDKNKDSVIFRAKESSIIKSANAAGIIAFANVLL